METTEPEPAAATGAPTARRRLFRNSQQVLVTFEGILYAAVGLLLAVAAALVLGATVSDVISDLRNGTNAVQVTVLILDRILLTLIVAELVFTLRFVLRTHEIVAEPFLFIGLIAVVRRILIVTAELERLSPSGRQLTNTLLELGLMAVLTFALAGAIFLIRRSDRRGATGMADPPEAARSPG